MSGSVSDSWPWLSSRRSAGKPLHIGSDGQKNWSRRNASAGWTEKLNHGKCLCLSWTKQGKRESPRPVLEDWVVRFRRQVVSGTRDSVVFCGFDVSVLGVSALPNYNHGYQVDTRWIPRMFLLRPGQIPQEGAHRAEDAKSSSESWEMSWMINWKGICQRTS